MLNFVAVAAKRNGTGLAATRLSGILGKSSPAWDFTIRVTTLLHLNASFLYLFIALSLQWNIGAKKDPGG